jgi:hypothetical protein
MVLLVLPSQAKPTEPVQDLAMFWTWSLKSANCEEDPNVGCRRLALRMGVSNFTIWRTLQKQGLHPYHLQRVQHLKPEDSPRRIAFVNGFFKKSTKNPIF